jgi:hypothetical protein
LVQGVVGRRASIQRFCPLGQFLRQSAVVGHRPPPVRQSLFGHQTSQSRLGRFDVEGPAGEQLLQRQTFVGRVRVQREQRVTELDPVGCLQSVCTHGTEVAPWSDVVGEDLQGGGRHGRVPLGMKWFGHIVRHAVLVQKEQAGRVQVPSLLADPEFVKPARVRSRFSKLNRIVRRRWILQFRFPIQSPEPENGHNMAAWLDASVQFRPAGSISGLSP